MPTQHRRNQQNERSAIDYLLIAVAGGVIASIGFSFVLWLKF